MKKIVFAHQKGGVGKSTIALNLGYALKKKGYKIALYDVDAQGTTFACAQTVKVYVPETIHTNVEYNYDYLIIDTPPYLTKEYLHLFIESDIVIIPTRPNPADIIEVQKTADLFVQAKYKNSKIKGYILFNSVDTRTSMLELVQPEVEKIGLPVLKSNIYYRVSYARSILDEEGIFSETDQKAHNEINDLANEIIEIIKV